MFEIVDMIAPGAAMEPAARPASFCAHLPECDHRQTKMEGGLFGREEGAGLARRLHALDKRKHRNISLGATGRIRPRMVGELRDARRPGRVGIEVVENDLPEKGQIPRPQGARGLRFSRPGSR